MNILVGIRSAVYLAYCAPYFITYLICDWPDRMCEIWVSGKCQAY